MTAPFPEEQAFQACLKMIEELEKGSLELKQISAVSAERGDHGVMLGAALCRDESGHLFVLKAVSGISKELVRRGFQSEYTGNQQPENQPEKPEEFALRKEGDIQNPENQCETISEAQEIFVPPVVSAELVNSALLKNDVQIHVLTDKIKQLKEERKRPDGKYNDQGTEEKKLCEKRAGLCNESLKAVYDLYSFCCADGKIRTLKEICGNKLPPTGTGDCCAPKLLHYACSHGLKVLSMAETFYGKSNTSKVQGRLYEPCDQRCGLILPSILGLKILYRDESIVVVDKQSGVLSVPGRGPEKQDCIVNRLKRLYPECIEQPSVHRLDMETSGLMVLALTEDAHRELNRQFENREVQKEYEALLDGKVEADETGTMELFFRVDLDNRPHQMWDEVYGKSAVTQWQLLGNEKYTHADGKTVTATRVRFIPHTGRTHQLRLASASEHGFGVPIIGDTLYGTCLPGERLLLHAKKLSFTHPVTKERMNFQCEPEF